MRKLTLTHQDPWMTMGNFAFVIVGFRCPNLAGLSGARLARRIAKILLCLLLLVCYEAPKALSQMRSLDVSQYLHTSWTAQQGYFRGVGISNNAIAQTADGYLWFLSPTGVFRFDGVRFVDWKPPNGGQLPGSPPTQLLASRDGSLWIGGDGVAQLRPDGTWHRYRALNALRRVRLAEDRDGVIWVGAENSPTPTGFSLFSIDHGEVIAHRLPEFAGLGLTPFLADKEGRLWADSKKGIWQLLPGLPKLVLNKTVPTPVFCEDAAGELLFAERGRVMKLTAQGTVEDYFGKLQSSPLNVRTMMRDRDGGLWIGTFGQGIVHFHEGRLDHFTSVDGLSSDTAESIFQDREGNVWVTSPDSIDEFTRPAVPRLTRSEGLSADSIFSVLTDRRGRTWVGTSDGFNEIVRGHIRRPGGQIQGDAGLAMGETRTAGLILTTHIRGEMAEGHAGRAPSGTPGIFWLEGYKNVFSVTEDNDGTLWAVSEQSGLLHLHKNGKLIKAIKDPDRGDFPVSVAFDRMRDSVWFSTHNGKLFLFKRGKILEHYGAAEGLGRGAVRIDEVDDDGGLWIASKSGLVHLQNHKISILGRKNGLPCQNVHWMRRDRDHHIWLYTGCGLISFSEQDLSSWIAQPSRSVKVTNYLDNTDGVENAAVGGWYAPQNTMTADGRILFAMRTGLGVLDPRDLNRNPLPPPVHIEGIAADGHETAIAHDVFLPANTAVIHIEYTALSFAAPRKVLFRYKLFGYDKTWSQPASLREVTYTNLPPRHYLFKVIASNNSGVWNERGAIVSFSVLPAWYQTLWFKVAVSLAIILFLWAAIQYRIYRTEQQVRSRFEAQMSERMRIARELHDTLLQSLQGLILSVSAFSAGATAPARVRDDMEGALDRAEELLVLGRDRIRDLRADDLAKNNLASELHELARPFGSHARPQVDVSIHGKLRVLNPMVQEEVMWVMREAISNARQHSGAAHIYVQLRYGFWRLRCIVQDDGQGMERDSLLEQKSGHFGMLGMRERSKRIHGRLNIHSVKGYGTTISLAVPARIAFGAHKKLSW
ncbi:MULTISPECIES: sensor histidine kinase [Acidobacterium]|nr:MULTISPECIES: sensor histidine kinase [Acidobacterium]HCT60832.1 hypothetical protein [Acidobacterium sp.]